MIEQMPNLSDLSKDELIELLNKSRAETEKLRAKIEELTTPPQNDWHAWFYALLQILLNKFSLFKKHNVIEFKSPDDALNMFTLWKGMKTLDSGR